MASSSLIGGSHINYQVHSSWATNNLSGVDSDLGEIAEALRCQIELQKRLREQLEVQKELQMRIEAQGKYLEAIQEKAKKSPTLDMNCSGCLEAARARL